ncbi:MAG: aminotransferase class I/II-fold pyridoxal phosphate-dependent enzyme [Mogibacterium sp.]|nr:aminotransferase class I/II-fold pyridoxal phosphate-dependent enzyme [Mogibacterium sp.]
MSSGYIYDEYNKMSEEARAKAEGRTIVRKEEPDTMSGRVGHGGDVYRNRVRLDFSVSLNPMPLPQSIMDAALIGLSEMHQYPDPVQQKLREGIASFENAAVRNVICASGASELLMAVCHAFRPRRALVTAPCYAGYERALRAVGAEMIEYTLDEANGFRLDDGLLYTLPGANIDMIILADPNNPDGRLMDAGLKKRISDVCDGMGITLVIDECFLPLTVRGLTREPIRDRALHLRAFTKTFAMPGIRIGYMLSADTQKLSKISGHLPEWNVSRIAEKAGEAAAEVMRNTSYLQNSVAYISSEKQRLTQGLAMLGIKVYESDANYILFKSRAGLYQDLLSKGIMIRRCSDYSGLDEHFYRIAVRTRDDNNVLLRTLKSLL